MTRMQLTVTALVGGTLALCFAPLTTAEDNGTRGGYTGAPGESTCIACHVPGAHPTSTASFDIQAPRSIVGSTALPVRVEFTGSNAVHHGFEMTARDSLGNPTGTWTITDPTNTKNTGVRHVTHTQTGILRSSWNVTWNRPSSPPHGPITLYAAGIEGDGHWPTGDQMHLTTHALYQASVVTQNTTWPLGSVQTLDLAAPRNAGEFYVLIASTGTTPTRVGSFELPVTVINPLFDLPFQGSPFFQGFYGSLDAAGSTRAHVIVPPVAFLSGLTWHFAFATFDARSNPTEVSQRLSVTLR